MGRVMASDIHVHGSLEMSGYRANFENAQEVRVPTPDQDNEATNKAYVDSLVSTSIASDNAKGLVQLAVTENVSNLSEYYLTYESGGSTLNPAQGDLVLLTGQTTASENGIYEVSSVNLSSSYSSSSSSSSRRFYFLYSGVAYLYVNRILASVHIDGSCLGEKMLLGVQDKWHGTLIAKEDCIFFSLARKDYLEYLKSFPLA